MDRDLKRFPCFRGKFILHYRSYIVNIKISPLRTFIMYSIAGSFCQRKTFPNSALGLGDQNLNIEILNKLNLL